MILGFGGLGAIQRRRQRLVVAARAQGPG